MDLRNYRLVIEGTPIDDFEGFDIAVDDGNTVLVSDAEQLRQVFDRILALDATLLSLLALD